MSVCSERNETVCSLSNFESRLYLPALFSANLRKAFSSELTANSKQDLVICLKSIFFFRKVLFTLRALRIKGQLGILH